MLRSIYTATSGLLNNSRILNVRGNNIANLSTAGFKEDRLVFSTMLEKKAVSQDINTVGPLKNIGDVNRGVAAVEIKTNFDQGSLQQTYRSLDFAIVGDGFFTVRHPDEENVYFTRNGQFQIDPDGYLIDGLGHYVLDDGESEIFVGNSSFMVTESGEVFDSNYNWLATLGVFVPDDPSLLMKSGENPFMFTGLDDYTPEQMDFAGVIRQGYIEMSNTDVSEQMAGLITASRNYQSLTNIIKTIDGMLGRSINDIGRV